MKADRENGMFVHQRWVRLVLTGTIPLVALLALWLLVGCLAAPVRAPEPRLTPTPAASDQSGPQFIQITTSSKSFVKSDCVPTAITVTAIISDPSGVSDVWLWHRVGAEQPFSQTKTIVLGDNQYVASVKGVDVPGSAYGNWEFYLAARDGVGNQSQSTIDSSVQFLPCVN